MKIKFKKLMIFICMFACMFSMTACSSADTSKEDALLAKYDSAQVQQITVGLFQSFLNTPEEEMASLVEADNSEIAQDVDMALAIKTAMSSWLNASGDFGDFVSADNFEMTTDGKNIFGTLTAKFSEREVVFEVTYAKDMSKYTAIKITPEYSTGEKLGKAAMNTLMGMGIVFVVLILIAFLISLFKYINKAETYFADKKLAKENNVPFEAKDPNQAPVVYEAEEEVDDLELIAVITAAVAASMNTSADNLVVRSIKRKKTNRWS